MHVLLAAISRRLIILFGLLLVPNLIAYAQEVTYIEDSANDGSVSSYGNAIDMYFSTYYAVGPEIIFGDQGADNIEFAPSVFAELKSFFRHRNYKNWVVNANVSVSDDDSRIQLNGDSNNLGNLQFDVDKLTVEYRCNCGLFYAGLFTANFGVPSRYQGLGLYGDDFINYDLDDKIGVGGEYIFSNGPDGKHTISGSVFDEFGSAAIALDGTLPQIGQSFRYHLAVSSEDQGDGASSEGVVAGIGQTGYALTQRTELQWLGELAHITNFENSGEDVTFFTLGGILDWEKYVASATYSSTSGDFGVSDDLDNLFAASAGYKIDGYGTLSIAYRYRDVNEISENTIALIYSNYHTFGSQF